MNKRNPMDKAQARERRNRLLESAATAELSLVEGVREMRTIAGMTQEEFARHREVSARVIKAIELGQGNPTVATLNRIGGFFGLEVGFVPTRGKATAMEQSPSAAIATETASPERPVHSNGTLVTGTIPDDLKIALQNLFATYQATSGASANAVAHKKKKRHSP